MSDAADSPAVAAIRAKLFDGIEPLPVFARAANVTPRTIQTYISMGMPCVWIGPSPYPVVDEAVEWIRTRRRRELARRAPGRPPNRPHQNGNRSSS